MSTETNDDNHVSTVRQILLDQMRALRAAPPEDVERELGRSKGVAELAQAVVNTAKVEVDYVKATGQGRTPFLEPPIVPPALPAPTSTHDKTSVAGGEGSGIVSITRHVLKG